METEKESRKIINHKAKLKSRKKIKKMKILQTRSVLILVSLLLAIIVNESASEYSVAEDIEKCKEKEKENPVAARHREDPCEKEAKGSGRGNGTSNTKCTPKSIYSFCLFAL